MAAPSIGHASKFSLAAPGTAIGSYTNAIECLSFNVQSVKENFDASGLRGARGRIAQRVRAARKVVRGSIRMQPTCNELAILLPWITGSVGSGSPPSFALAESMETNGKQDLLIDLVAKRVTYLACQVNRARFLSRPASPLEVTLDVEGLLDTDSGTAFPAVTFTETDADRPLMHSDLTCTLEGAGQACFDVEITIDNALNTNRFVNSTVRTFLPATDRIVSGRISLPFTSDETALQVIADSMAIADLDGITVLLVWAFNNVSLTFGAGTSYKLQTEGRKPIVNGRGDEIGLELTGQFRRIGALQEGIFTLDSTP